MPIVIAILAAAIIASGIRGTYRQLGALIVSDFTTNSQGGNAFSSGAASGGASASPTFFTWLIAVGCVGAIGYVPALQRFSRVFLALIVVACFVRQGSGLFAKFTAALQGATAGAPVQAPGQTITIGSANGGTSGTAGIPSVSDAAVDGFMTGGVTDAANAALGAAASQANQAMSSTMGSASSAVNNAIGSAAGKVQLPATGLSPQSNFDELLQTGP